MNKTVAIVGAVLVLALAVGGFWYMKSSQKDTDMDGDDMMMTNEKMMSATPTMGMTMTTEESSSSSDMMMGEGKEIVVSGSNFAFAPSEIKVKKGEKVMITFKNTGGFHDFVIDEFDVRTNQIKDGEEESVEFTADKAGTFEYYCSVGQHRQMGMKGKLIVE